MNQIKVEAWFPLECVVSLEPFGAEYLLLRRLEPFGGGQPSYVAGFITAEALAPILFGGAA